IFYDHQRWNSYGHPPSMSPSQHRKILKRLASLARAKANIQFGTIGIGLVAIPGADCEYESRALFSDGESELPIFSVNVRI
ncbi:MAG: hypothetical protein AAGM16_16285, partial [Pseudomonadota bacterium]